MNNKISTGIWLVFAGIVFLLDNFHIINFDFLEAIKYWPLLLVSLGVSLLVQNKSYGSYAIIGVNLIFCVFVFFKGLHIGKDFESTVHTRTDVVTVDNEDENTEGFARKVGLPLNSEIKSATLKINGGAAKYSFTELSSPDSLFTASTFQPNTTLRLNSHGNENVNIELNTQIKSGSIDNNVIQVALQKSVEWNLEYNIGAASIVGDFRDYRIRNIDVNSGASSLNLTLPDPTSGISNIEINTAASSIKLHIPKNVACRVESESFLSNNKLEDIGNKEGKVSKSTDYDNVNNKYNITIKGAANSLTVLRY